MKAALALCLFPLISGVFPPQNSTQTNPPFSIVISVPSEVRSGHGVEVKIELTNRSNHNLNMSTAIIDLTGADPNFVVDVRDSKGNPTPKRVYDHADLATWHALVGYFVEPGKTYTEGEDVARQYDMTTPGQYVIQVSRRVSNNPADGFIKSNTVTVTVTPKPPLSWTDPSAYPPFDIVISGPKEVKAGGIVLITVALTNHWTHVLDMSGWVSDLYQQDPNYMFTVYHADGSPDGMVYYSHPELFASHLITRTVDPGETYTEEQPISRVYDMTKPGEYIIQVSRRRSDNRAGGDVESNKITVTITP